MNDLHKYIISSIAGAIMCLCCIGGYYLFLDNRSHKTNIPQSAQTASNQQTIESGPPTASFQDNREHDHNTASDLTSDQEARLSAARNANANLTKQSIGTGQVLAPTNNSDTKNTEETLTTQHKNKLIADSTDFAKKSTYIQSNQPKPSKNEKPVIKNEHFLEKQHKQVHDLITQGKNAVQQKQLNTAIGLFDEADALMPADDKAFAALSYNNMSNLLLQLSKELDNDYNAKTARDKAELYIRKSLAAENSLEARSLYAKLIEEQQEAIRRKKQQDLITQQAILKKESEQTQLTHQRNRIQDSIAEGKDAALKNQTDSALHAFDQADHSMPDDTAFTTAAYQQMADILYGLYSTLSSQHEKKAVLNKAEDYIKKALAAENTAGGRTLYATIINEQKKLEEQKKHVEEQKKQELLQAQQRAKKQQQAGEKEKKLIEQRQKVQELITQGKNAVKNKQLDSALTFFDAIIMPEDTKFAAKSYHDVAHTVHEIANTIPNLEKKKEVLQKAEAYIKKARAAENTTENIQLHTAIVNAIKQTDEQKKAFDEHQKQTELHAKQAEARKKQEAAAAQQQTEKVRTQVKKLITEGKNNTQNKQLEPALTAFEKAETIMPEDTKFAAASYREIAQALFLLAKGNTQEKTALISYSRAEYYIRKSIEALDALASRDLYEKISKSQQEILRKQEQRAQKKKEEAEAQQKKAQTDIEKRKLTAQGLIIQGKKAAESRNFSAAQNFFQKAAASIPKEDAAFLAQKYAEMADCLYTFAKKNTAKKNEALKKSEEYIKKALIATKGDASAHFLYSQIADELKQAKIALQELEQAHKIEPDNYVYNYELGKKYFDLKEYELARAFFEKAGKPPVK